MDARKLIVLFNNTFPLDKPWRDSKGIIFNSEEHRKIDQIDLYYQFLENQLYQESLEEAKIQKEKEDQLKKGRIIKEKIPTKEESDKLFEMLKNSFSKIK